MPLCMFIFKFMYFRFCFFFKVTSNGIDQGYIYNSWCVWLVSYISWHINPCQLFNAKFIFMQIVSSISNN